jgi:hypothetical protein
LRQKIKLGRLGAQKDGGVLGVPKGKCFGKPERIYVDKGYRGHDFDQPHKVFLAGRKKGLTPQMKRELKRCSAIEPTIGQNACVRNKPLNHLDGGHAFIRKRPVLRRIPCNTPARLNVGLLSTGN